MDEQSWLASDDFYGLLTIPKTRDDRKRRLIFCAIGRTVLRLLPDPEKWETAIQFAERWADGEFDRDEWLRVRKTLSKLAKGLDSDHQTEAAGAIRCVTERKFMDFKMACESATFAFCKEARSLCDDDDQDPWREISDATALDHLALVREVYGNPFKKFEIDSKVLSWKENSVQSIADEIYESGEFNSLGILGDALTEAGCKHDEIVSHCYHNQHVRGCWVVDLIRTYSNP